MGKEKLSERPTRVSFFLLSEVPTAPDRLLFSAGQFFGFRFFLMEKMEQEKRCLFLIPPFGLTQKVRKNSPESFRDNSSVLITGTAVDQRLQTAPRQTEILLMGFVAFNRKGLPA